MSAVSVETVNEDEGGMRLDRWFRERYPALGHGALQKLLRTGQVRVDGGRAKANQRVESGQQVRVPPGASDATGPAPVKKPHVTASSEDRRLIGELTLYEDKDIIVLNKPAGLAVQGGSKTTRHIDGILAGMGEGEKRPRLVHRLDRETSGVLVIAKRRSIAADMGKAFASRSVRKIYWAVVGGVPHPMQGRISLPLIKAAGPNGDRVRPAQPDEADAQQAVTNYAVVDRAAGKAAWVSLKPVTGRQHQLRVHMQAIETPIMGDDKYGGAELVPPVLTNRLHLHARRVMFRHPRSGESVDVTAPLPPHMVETFSFFGFEAGAASGIDDAVSEQD